MEDDYIFVINPILEKSLSDKGIITHSIYGKEISSIYVDMTPIEHISVIYSNTLVEIRKSTESIYRKKFQELEKKYAEPSPI